MKNSILITIILLIFTACQEIGDNEPLLGGKKGREPIIIVNKNPHLNIPEFWIDKVDNPERVIMGTKEIEEFNNEVAYVQKRLTYFKDTALEYNSSWVKSTIEKSFISFTSQKKYFIDGYKVPDKFYKSIKSDMNLDSIVDSLVKTKYAITVNYTNQKIIPTELALLKKSQQIYFDRNQNSALDIATPIAILHSTTNGEWHYGVTPTSSGWVKDKNIAFAEKKEIENYLNSRNFIITTSAKSAVLVAGKYYDYLRMGVRLPYILGIDDMAMVLLPTRNKDGELVLSNATIKKSDIHRGYLEYTPKNILLQAFKFLNAPYGWGGSYGEQDCSKFLQEIYATVGLKIPRNSLSQSFAGSNFIKLENLSKDTKIELLSKKTFIGATIIHLTGHIVLYLGNYKGEPYIIHTVWGSSKKHFPLGRTAVTSLEFNEYIEKIDRVTNLNINRMK